MTNTLTFTQGTEAVADVKAFTPDVVNHTLAKDKKMTIVTSGTTATAGEVVVTLEFLGVD